MWEGRENRIAACDVSKSNISKLLHCSLVNIDGFDPDFLVVVALPLALWRDRLAVAAVLGWSSGCFFTQG